jgi:uncharacterized protein (TIGR02453 family)
VNAAIGPVARRDELGPFLGFPEGTKRFLGDLSLNNDRAWFEAHGGVYERVVIEPAKALVAALGPRLRQLDPKIQAIPRVRGSIKSLERRVQYPRREVPPYKPNLDLWFWSGARRAWDNSGFFLRLTASRLILAAGMIEFQKVTLARYRERVLDTEPGEELAAIVHELASAGYVVGGESYKRTPRGVPSDHPRAALLKNSGLFASLNGEHPDELHTPGLVEFVFGHFARMASLHLWLVGMHVKARQASRTY